MSGHMVHLAPTIPLAAASLLLAFAFGCNSAPPAGGQKNSPGLPAAAVTASSRNDDSGINLQCAADRIQKAPAPFHWSFKKAVPPMTNADWEADVMPDSIAGTLIDSSGTRAIHGVRSDSTSWNTAVLALTGPLPASTFALVSNSSATVRASAEDVNGEETIKYTIDTSHATSGETALIRNVLGKEGYVKGTAWVTARGCPVKFVLDVEQHNNDGSVQKEHYEANVTQP